MEKDEFTLKNGQNAAWKDIFALCIKKDLIYYTGTILITFASSIPDVMIPTLIGKIFELFARASVQAITNDEFQQALLPYIITFLAIGCGAIVINWIFLSVWISWGELHAFRARQCIISYLIGQNIEHHDLITCAHGKNVGNKFHRQVEDYSMANAQPLGYSLQNIFIFFFSLGVAFYKSWMLTLMILGCIPIVALVAGICSSKTVKYVLEEKQHLSSASSVLSQSIEGISTIKALNVQKQEMFQFSNFVSLAGKAFSRLANIIAIQQGTSRFVILGMFSSGFWFGSFLIRSGKCDAGSILTAFWSCLAAIQAISNIGPQMLILEKGKAAGNSLNNYQPRIREKPENFYPLTCSGDIKFRNIDFAYPSRQDRLILSNLSLTVSTGQLAFIVGKSGSGKSTLGALLSKVHTSYSGHIYVDGYDLKTLHEKWIWNNVTFVEQFGGLFSGNLEENITFGKQNADATSIQRACHFALLQEVIQNLPQGLRTDVENACVALSGGEKQKVLLARARLRDTPILILDESLSALDKICRSLIFEAIRSWRHNRTTIVITHDYSQIEAEDMVYVLSKGMVAEQGTRRSLEANRDVFYELLQSENKATKSLHSLVTSFWPQHESQLIKNQTIINKDCYSVNKRLSSSLNQRSLGTSNLSDLKLNQDMEYLQRVGLAAYANRIKLPSRRSPCVPDSPLLITEEVEVLPFVQLLKNLWYSVSNKLTVIVGWSACIINGASTPAFAFSFSKLLALYFNGTPVASTAAMWAIIMLLIAFVDGCSTYIRYYLLELAGQRWIDCLRQDTYSRILHQDRGFFDIAENKASYLCRILICDTEDMKTLFGRFAGNMLVAMSMVILGCITALIVGWQLALLGCCVVAPVIYSGSKVFSWLCTRFERRQKDMKDRVAACLQEIVSMFATIKLFRLDTIFVEKHTTLITNTKSSGFQRAIIVGIGFGVLESLVYFVQALMFWYGGELVTKGTFTPSQMLTVFSMIVFSLMNASSIVGMVPQVTKAKIGSLHMLRLMKLTLDTAESVGSKKIDVHGHVAFENVCFAYPSQPNMRVLHNICLRFEPGTFVVLVGQSGSGKSSLVSLIQRLYEPCSGSILVDGQPLNSLDVLWLRTRVISSVSQSTLLFNKSIAENIVYGSAGRIISHDQITQCAKQAGIHDFVMSLPRGYDTVLDSEGSDLSGGQAQQLAFARALLKDPRILILDECTSALDPKAAKFTRNMIQQMRGYKTVIATTHDVEMMQDADRIVVLKHGKVTEVGNFSELMARQKDLYSIVHQGEWAGDFCQ